MLSEQVNVAVGAARQIRYLQEDIAKDAVNLMASIRLLTYDEYDAFIDEERIDAAERNQPSLFPR